MKTFTLLTALILSVSFGFSQTFMVNYDMIMSSDKPEIQAQLGMMDGSSMQIFYVDQKSKVESNMAGGLMKSSTIMDFKKKKGMMTTEGMMGNQAAIFDIDEDMDEEDEETSFEIMDETKDILGYTCKKGIMYGEDDTEAEYWFTEDIQVVEGSLGKFVQKGVPGLPLEIIIRQADVTIKFVAKEVNNSFKETKGMFNVKIPKGFNEVSIDMLKNMGG